MMLLITNYFGLSYDCCCLLLLLLFSVVVVVVIVIISAMILIILFSCVYFKKFSIVFVLKLYISLIGPCEQQ